MIEICHDKKKEEGGKTCTAEVSGSRFKKKKHIYRNTDRHIKRKGKQTTITQKKRKPTNNRCAHRESRDRTWKKNKSTRTETQTDTLTDTDETYEMNQKEKGENTTMTKKRKGNQITTDLHIGGLGIALQKEAHARR